MQSSEGDADQQDMDSPEQMENSFAAGNDSSLIENPLATMQALVPKDPDLYSPRITSMSSDSAQMDDVDESDALESSAMLPRETEEVYKTQVTEHALMEEWK